MKVHSPTSNPPLSPSLVTFRCAHIEQNRIRSWSQAASLAVPCYLSRQQIIVICNLVMSVFECDHKIANKLIRIPRQSLQLFHRFRPNPSNVDPSPPSTVDTRHAPEPLDERATFPWSSHHLEKPVQRVSLVRVERQGSVKFHEALDELSVG